MGNLRFSVILHKAEEGGYWASVPALAGCVSQGETKKEALSNIKEAIKLYIEVLKEDGKPIPSEPEFVESIEVAV